MARSSEADLRGPWTWSAVVAGTIAALITQVLLTLLALGVGLVTVDVPTATAAPAATGTAALLWWIASGVFAAFVGGTIAAAYAPYTQLNARIAYALSAWALATLIVIGAAGLAAGGVFTNLAGPGARATVAFQNANRPGAPAISQAQLENARKAVAAASFASFIGLLLGAAAAGLGGWYSTEIRSEVGARARR